MRNGKAHPLLPTRRKNKAGVDRSGRGCNPRPARSRASRGRIPKRGLGTTRLWRRLGGGSPLLGSCGGGSFRSGVQPPTGIRSERSTPAKCVPAIPNPERPPAMNLLIGFCFLFVVPLLLRGWSFPVGGSTPDRHKDRHRIGTGNWRGLGFDLAVSAFHYRLVVSAAVVRGKGLRWAGGERSVPEPVGG